MPLLKKSRSFFIHAETTPGTAATLAAANGVFVFDAAVDSAINMHERSSSQTLGHLPPVPGLYAGKAQFKTELAPASGGGEPTWFAPLMAACGFVKGGNAWAPTSNPASYVPVTIGSYEKGTTGSLIKIISGAMGKLKLTGKVSEPIMMEWDFDGIWNAPIDGSALALPAIPPIPPRFASAAFTIGGYNPAISNFTLDFGNAVKLIENPSTVSGLSYACVTDHNVKGTIDPMSTNISVWNPYALALSPTPQALSMTCGGLTISAPSVSLSIPKLGDRDGLTTGNIDLSFNEVLGDDAVSISFATGS